MNATAVGFGHGGPIHDLQKIGGLFRKTAKLAAARHVRRESLPCEQRGAGFKNSDSAGDKWNVLLCFISIYPNPKPWMIAYYTRYIPSTMEVFGELVKKLFELHSKYLRLASLGRIIFLE
jgi:hypothetical protein